MRRTLRLRLLRRRLTISAPRMAIRSRLPWPLRWAVAAVVLGFCGAIAMWAFQFGKDIAGLDRGVTDDVPQLRAQNDELRRERDELQSRFDTSGSLMTAERAERDRLIARIRTLERENGAMRDDLAFFEHLLPATGDGIAIRGLQAELVDGHRLKWQVLLMLPGKKTAEFRGRLELTMSGTLAGQSWSMALPGGPQPLQFRQYRRVEGAIDLPQQAVVQNVTAKVVEGSAIRAVQSIQL